MGTRWLFSVGVAVTAGYLLLALHPRVQAADKPDPKAATIEFQDIPDQPHLPGQPLITYDLGWVIELDGLPQPIRIKGSVSAGATATFQAFAENEYFEDFKGLQYKLTADRGGIIIKGLKDPKTGVFHPIKRVTFTSQTRPKGARMMPKAGMPKVTNPKLPAA